MSEVEKLTGAGGASIGSRTLTSAGGSGLRPGPGGYGRATVVGDGGFGAVVASEA